MTTRIATTTNDMVNTAAVTSVPISPYHYPDERPPHPNGPRCYDSEDKEQ